MANFLNKISEMVFGPQDDYEDDFIMPEEEEDDDILMPRPSGRKNKVVNINTTTQLKVVVIQPETFEEAKEIADHLKSKKTVVINLESLEKEIARRMIDFISGSVYALDGSIQKVSSGIFLIAPYNVGILSDFKDELKNQGIFPWSY